MIAVLDASVVLALLFDEPGCDAAEPYIGTGYLSVVNYSEVVARLADRGAPPDTIETQIAALGFELVPFGQKIAREAGLLRPATREFGLSFADRACLATAATLKLPALTADQVWAELDIGIPIQLIR